MHNGESSKKILCGQERRNPHLMRVHLIDAGKTIGKAAMMMYRVCAWVLVSFTVALVGCGDSTTSEQTTSEQTTSEQTTSEQTTSEQTTTTQSQTPTGIMEIKAPRAAVDLWRGWDGKYVLFAHRDAQITVFEDLAGKSIVCAYINTDEEPWVCDNIIRDLQSLQTVGPISFAAGIQNNLEYYGKQLLERPATIGFMSAGIARYYNFAEEKTLVQLVLVE